MWLTLSKKNNRKIRFAFDQKWRKSFLLNSVAVKSALKEVKEMGVISLGANITLLNQSNNTILDKFITDT